MIGARVRLALARQLGTLRPVREGIRARLVDRLFPWDHERDQPFEVSFHGYRYTGNLADHQDYNVYFRGGYENSELALLKALGTEIADCVAFDVGASTGQHMLVLASCCAKVYAFEPFAKSRQVAARRIGENGIANVELLPFGLGVSDESLPYYWDESNTNQMAGSFVSEHAHMDLYDRLEVRNGDSWAGSAGVSRMDLIKIDVEGFEADVLAGLRKLLAAQPVIMLEVSWTSYDRIAAGGGLAALVPFPHRIFRVATARDAIFFNFGRYELWPVEELRRPTDVGYNILIVPERRLQLGAVAKHIRRRNVR